MLLTYRGNEMKWISEPSFTLFASYLAAFFRYSFHFFSVFFSASGPWSTRALGNLCWSFIMSKTRQRIRGWVPGSSFQDLGLGSAPSREWMAQVRAGPLIAWPRNAALFGPNLVNPLRANGAYEQLFIWSPHCVWVTFYFARKVLWIHWNFIFRWKCGNFKC